MSHFSRIKTSIRDLPTLQAVLTQLDISWEKIDFGTSRNFNALELILHQPHVIDMGFSFNGYEYEFVTDRSFWQQTLSVESFVSKINQTYTSKLLNKELENLGFSAVRCLKTEHGTIDLVAEKWLSDIVPARSFVSG
jgi:hypothetical protein